MGASLAKALEYSVRSVFNVIFQKRYRSNRVLLYNNDKASIFKDMNIVEIEQSHSRGKIVSQTFDRTPIEYSEFAFPTLGPEKS